MAQDSFRGPNDRRKRREIRRAARDVAGSAGGLPVRVLNVSQGGLGLQSDQPLRVGKTYPVALRGREVAIEVPSTARWCQMSIVKAPGSAEGAQVYGVGLRFEDISGEEVRMLETLVGAPLVAEPADALAGATPASSEFALRPKSE